MIRVAIHDLHCDIRTRYDDPTQACAVAVYAHVLAAKPSLQACEHASNESTSNESQHSCVHRGKTSEAEEVDDVGHSKDDAYMR